MDTGVMAPTHIDREDIREGDIFMFNTGGDINGAIHRWVIVEVAEVLGWREGSGKNGPFIGIRGYRSDGVNPQPDDRTALYAATGSDRYYLLYRESWRYRFPCSECEGLAEDDYLCKQCRECILPSNGSGSIPHT